MFRAFSTRHSLVPITSEGAVLGRPTDYYHPSWLCLCTSQIAAVSALLLHRRNPQGWSKMPSREVDSLASSEVLMSATCGRRPSRDLPSRCLSTYQGPRAVMAQNRPGWRAVAGIPKPKYVPPPAPVLPYCRTYSTRTIFRTTPLTSDPSLLHFPPQVLSLTLSQALQIYIYIYIYFEKHILIRYPKHFPAFKMSKRTVFTTLTPLPAGITRETVMETLRAHTEMIDLNPLVEERHPIKPPPNATPEEYHCLWYSLTDRVQYLPGGIMSGKVSYNACFHDLENGLQTHCYAPMGLNIRGKWTLGGSLPGEPVVPVELGVGAPLHGLWLREDVDMKCNIMMTNFVKKTLKKAHSHLVDRLVIKAQILDAANKNQQIEDNKLLRGPFNNSQASTEYSPSEYETQSSVDNCQSQHFLPPQRPISRFRVPEYTSSTDNTNESNMYPKPLSAHSSTASYSGSASGSQRGHSLYPDQAQGSQNAPRERVSWQNLQPNRSPSIPPIEPAPAYQSNYPYQGHGQGYYSTELHSQERQNSKPVPNDRRYQNYSSPSFLVELE